MVDLFKKIPYMLLGIPASAENNQFLRGLQQVQPSVATKC